MTRNGETSGAFDYHRAVAVVALVDATWIVGFGDGAKRHAQGRLHARIVAERADEAPSAAVARTTARFVATFLLADQERASVTVVLAEVALVAVGAALHE